MVQCDRLDHMANGMYTGINLSVVWFTTITVSDGKKKRETELLQHNSSCVVNLLLIWPQDWEYP